MHEDHRADGHAAAGTSGAATGVAGGVAGLEQQRNGQWPFAPCNDRKYVVVVMIPDSGYGADVAAPAVRQIWDGIYGPEGHKATVPSGQVPSALPQITSTGAIQAPAGYTGGS